MNRTIKVLIVIAAMVVLLCGWLFREHLHHRAVGSLPVIDSAELKSANLFNRHAVDTTVSMLRPGNVVLRMGLGADSKLLSGLNSKDKSFSHCGIVFIENGYPFVYHSIGGEDNPDERLRRDSAWFFFSPQYNSEIGVVHFPFDTAQVSELRRVVYALYKLRPKFDMKFDLATDDKLYCSEFVYKAINKAMHDTGYIHTTNMFGHTFVGVDDIYMNEHANIVWRIKFK
jgi:hypothetical protein